MYGVVMILAASTRKDLGLIFGEETEGLMNSMVSEILSE